jgi:metallo-beta-lactamase family protein
MKLTFLGAAREVTGSRYFLEACGKRILIDYGMEQGRNYFENTLLPVPADAVDYVFLTHAHIDHSGWLPLLYKNGFRGQIFATEATHDLCSIMLLDSAHIQEMEAEWKNRKAMRSGATPEEPLYTIAHATETVKLFTPCPYDTNVFVCEGISIQLVDVGHLLGSASILVSVTEEGKAQRIAFSGDIGNLHQPLLRDPDYITGAEYVVMESTYGDRTHGPVPDYVGELVQILNDTFARGGNVVIPSFAVGRTQELLYFFRQIKEEKRITSHPAFAVYVDSPLAVQATNIFNEHMHNCMDADTLALIKQGIDPIKFDGLKVSVTSDESKAINDDPTPKVIISASGMCDAGRIRHHLKHNLWRPESTVLFVGFQSPGTLGRLLLDGVKEVKLFGESISVVAEVRRLSGISGHADQNGLLKWIGSFEGDIRHVFVTHGENEVAAGFAKRLATDLNRAATAPYNGEVWDLTSDTMLAEGNRTLLVRESDQPDGARREGGGEGRAPEGKPAQPAAGPRAGGWRGRRETQQKPDTAAYAQLREALGRLSGVVNTMEGSPKKAQSKLAAAIFGLVNKFGRR